MKLCEEVYMPPSVIWPHIPAVPYAVFDETPQCTIIKNWI